MDYKLIDGVLYVAPTKLMYLEYMRSKQSDKGAAYILAFLFILVGLPSLATGLTFGDCIGLFMLVFFGSMHIYNGWITTDTVNAWTEN
jgi:hypothetical protein